MADWPGVALAEKQRRVKTGGAFGQGDRAKTLATSLGHAEFVVIRRVQMRNPAIPDVANDFPAVAMTTCFAAVFYRNAGQVAGRWGGLPAARDAAFVSAGGSGRGGEVV